MVEKARHEPGTFCWVELATSDGAAAKTFYSLFGWTADDTPGGGGVYTTLRKNGKAAAALYEPGPEQKGIPPHWSSYVYVENADDAAAQAKELGGTVMMGPFDVMEHGRMAVVADPTGAVFSLWQARSHIGRRSSTSPGRSAGTSCTRPTRTARRTSIRSSSAGRGNPVTWTSATTSSSNRGEQ
jgi:predicted enzyme related to lactoylglutathione lyase